MTKYEALKKGLLEELFTREPFALALTQVLERDYPGLRQKVLAEYDELLSHWFDRLAILTAKDLDEPLEDL